MLQPQLTLRVSARTVLVTTETVRAALGLDADSISAQVDSGELRWVWDISLGDRQVRDLRFWAREIIAPETCRDLSPAEVIDTLVSPNRDHYRGTEVSQLLLISRPQVKILGAQLGAHLVGHTLRLPRAALARFLNERLIGAVLPKNP